MPALFFFAWKRRNARTLCAFDSRYEPAWRFAHGRRSSIRQSGKDAVEPIEAELAQDLRNLFDGAVPSGMEPLLVNGEHSGKVKYGWLIASRCFAIFLFCVLFSKTGASRVAFFTAERKLSIVFLQHKIIYKCGECQDWKNFSRQKNHYEFRDDALKEKTLRRPQRTPERNYFDQSANSGVER